MLPPRTRSVFVVVCLALALLPAVPASAVHRPGTRIKAEAPLVVIVMENKSYDEIVGSPDAPYINDTMIARGTVFTNSNATHDPSLPNYLALTAGSSLGCTTNQCEPGYEGPNLFRQLQRNAVPWRVWASDMPEPCARYDQGLYVVRHNPGVFYDNIHPLPCTKRVIPFPETLPDTLPRFVLIVPDVCQDMHDCSVAFGDAWLSDIVPPLRARGAVVLLTFDESSDGTSRIATVALGPGIRRGATDGHRYTHYGVLAGIETRFGLPLLRNAQRARPMPI